MTIPRKCIFLFLLLLSACSQSADNVQEAASILTDQSRWRIDEISVNDAITFKEGKMTQQFGGVDFERYMETVELKNDGTFSGVFKGETQPFILKWKENKANITVGAADANAKGGEWTIEPRDVSSSSFIMKTQSTAYDYPRVTRIALKFKAAK
ncbi:hypothetical protein FEM33_24870 [Dyadobacter flavalbus]|uniref:DUF5004 domain-containing protein n=2 Tax=Dyadobacter flavalbus TaxID=2579942 RepID=A0A5M8Q8V9_9BACT|nr:hypothetical protein FEM33_24870 [Dyadobacter flavalbus]